MSTVKMEEMKNGSSPQESREDILRRIQTSDSVWLPRDVFESIYLNPERKVAGDLRQKVRLVRIRQQS